MISPEFEPQLVSVIIPTYNRANYIKRTIESVIEQHYRPIELIVVDDGSTDLTKDVVSDLNKRCWDDAEISLHYLFQKRSGAAAARNKAFCISRGEFIQVIDSDDLLSANKLKNQVTALGNNPDFCVAYGNWKIHCDRYGLMKYGPLRQKKPVESEDSMLRGYLSAEWFCPIHSYLFRREVIAHTGFFDERLLRRQDTDYLIRVLLNRHRFLYVKRATAYYTRHGGEHIGNPTNYDKHFLSSLWVIENAYSILNQYQSVDQYSEEIKKYLMHLAKEAFYMGYHRGVEMVEEKIKAWFMNNLGEYDLHFNHAQMSFKRNVVKLGKHFLGDCVLDWINKAAGKGPGG